MASSFIDIGKFGFWAKDGFVESMQLCLINEIEKSELEKDEKWLNEYKVELAVQSLPIVFGGMSMVLEEFITNQERKNIIIKLIDSIIQRISNEPKYLTGEKMHSLRKRAMEILRQTEKVKFKNEKEFNRYVNDSNWEGSAIHNVKANYAHSFKLLRKLVKGGIQTTASSTIDYWNY